MLVSMLCSWYHPTSDPTSFNHTWTEAMMSSRYPATRRIRLCPHSRHVCWNSICLTRPGPVQWIISVWLSSWCLRLRLSRFRWRGCASPLLPLRETHDCDYIPVCLSNQHRHVPWSLRFSKHKAGLLGCQRMAAQVPIRLEDLPDLPRHLRMYVREDCPHKWQSNEKHTRWVLNLHSSDLHPNSQSFCQQSKSLAGGRTELWILMIGWTARLTSLSWCIAAVCSPVTGHRHRDGKSKGGPCLLFMHSTPDHVKSSNILSCLSFVEAMQARHRAQAWRYQSWVLNVIYVICYTDMCPWHVLSTFSHPLGAPPMQVRKEEEKREAKRRRQTSECCETAWSSEKCFLRNMAFSN